MERNRFRPIQGLNILAYAAMATVNALAVLLPINGVTPGEVSDAYPNLFAPPAITFSIWGVIYFLLLVFTVYQSGVFTKGMPPAAERMGWLFVLSSLCNIAWIFCWHYDRILLSLLCMAGLLVCLVLAFVRIGFERLCAAERVFVRLPFAVYFGWITVAAMANVTVTLVYAGWDGFGLPPQLWTAVVLLIGLALGLAVILRQRAPAYGLTMVWAYLGIFSRHLSPSGFDGAYPLVIWVSGICAAALFVVSLFVLFSPRR